MTPTAPAAGPSGAFAPEPFDAGFAPTPAQPAPGTGKGAAAAALGLGIAAFLTGWIPLLGLGLGIAAVILGIIAIRRRQSKGMAIAGIVVGAIGLLTSLLMSFVAVAVATNFDEFSAAFEEQYNIALNGSTTPAEQAEASPDEDVDVVEAEPETPQGPAPIAAYAPLDDATFAAILADPVAAYGQTYIMYGEIQQLDEYTGPCTAIMTVDDTQQGSWEGYAAVSWLVADSSVSDCPEFAGLAALTHVKAWVTVLGTTTTEWDDGTVEDVLNLGLRQAEVLPALP